MTMIRASRLVGIASRHTIRHEHHPRNAVISAFPSTTPANSYPANATTKRWKSFQSFFAKDKAPKPKSEKPQSHAENDRNTTKSGGRIGFSNLMEKNQGSKRGSPRQNGQNFSQNGYRSNYNHQQNEQQNHRVPAWRRNDNTRGIHSPFSNPPPVGGTPASLGSQRADKTVKFENNERVESNKDLKDISPLRNAFMQNRVSVSTTPSTNQWRESPTKTESSASPSWSPNSNLNSSRIGTSWRPSFYGKSPPDPPKPPQPAAPPSTPKVEQSEKSIEEVLKASTLQRKRDAEQRFRNDGQSRFGRGNSGNRNNFNWRDRPNQNSYQNQRQPNQYQNKNVPNQKQQQQQPYKKTSQPSNQNHPGKFNKFNNRRRLRKPIKPSTAPTKVKLPSSSLTLVDYSLLLRVRKRSIVRILRSLGEPISYKEANQDSYKLDPEMMEYVAIDLGIEVEKEAKKVSGVEKMERRALRGIGRNGESLSEEQGEESEAEQMARLEEEERYASYPPRSPVVSIMGHVDHGKTTLMDALRRRAVTGADTPKGSGKASSKKGKKKGGKRGEDRVTVKSGNVAGTEAGGITQVITAFEVPLPLEDKEGLDEEGTSGISTVTFLDTPGHAAFKKMRQSGTSATDVIVLVIAADDGVSPQTVEILQMFQSIYRSQPGSISLVVAVSKIDKPGIDIDESIMMIEGQLAEYGIFTENMVAGGGDEGEFGACQLFPVSGITGDGLDDLVEGLALQSEIMDLRADEDAQGEGIVIDARMEKGLGVVADCVVRWGKVEVGDFVVSGTNGGRVKFLNDVGNKPLKKAKPSQPVRIIGFKSLPKAGDSIVCAPSEEEAKDLIRLRESETNLDRAAFDEDRTLDLQVTGTAAKQGAMLQKAHDYYRPEGEGSDEDVEGDNDNGVIRIPVVIKADSHGALEAVRDALVSMGVDSKLDIVVDPIAMSTGVITTTDVTLAKESDAAIFTFGKVGMADKETKSLAEAQEVPVRNHEIIYRLLEDAKELFSKYLPFEQSIKVHGKATVQAVFEVTDANKKEVSIAGLRVNEGNLFKQKSKPGSDGSVAAQCFYRVIRKGKTAAENLKASSLRKVKDDVDNVKRGEECGLGLAGFNDLEDGDVVECYSIEEIRPKI